MAKKDEEMRYREESSVNSSMQTTVKVGSLLGAGAVGIRYRREIGSGIRSAGEFGGTLVGAGVERLARSTKFKATMQDIGTFAKALDHAADGRSLLSHFGNPNRFNNRWERSVQSSIEARGRMRSDGIASEQLSTVKALEDTVMSIRNAPKNVFQAHRMEHIRQHLQKTMPKQFEDGLNSVLTAKVGNNQQWLDRITKDSVASFTEALEKGAYKSDYQPKFNTEKQRQNFQDKLFEALDTYKDRKSLGWQNKEAVKDLKRVTKKTITSIRDGFLESRKSRQDFMAKVMEQRGYRRATLDDAVHAPAGNLLEEQMKLLQKRPLLKPKKDGTMHTDNISAQKITELVKKNPKYADLIADEHLWVNRTGEFLDTRWMARGAINFADGFRRNMQVPFLRFNPLDLLHFSTWDAVRTAPKTVFKKMGTIDPGLHGSVEELKHPLAHNQDAAVGILATNYINTADGKVFSLTTGDLVKEGVYQASGRFGMIPRSIAGMANLHVKNYERTGALGKLGEIFDVGRQETESIFSRSKSVATKFDNHQWGPNVINAHKRWRDTGGAEGLDAESTYKILFAQLESKTAPLSDDVIDYINPVVSKAYGDIGVDLKMLETDEGTLDAFGRIVGALQKPNSGLAKVVSLSDGMGGGLEGIESQLTIAWKKYHTNPTQYLSNQRIAPNSAPYLPEWLSALDFSETDLVNKIDDVRRLVEQHAMRQVEYAREASGGFTVASLVRQGIDEGHLDKTAIKEVRNLEALTSMRQYWDDVYIKLQDKDDALSEFSERIVNESDHLSIVTQDAMKDFNPWWAMGPGQEPPQYFGFVSTLSMNKGKGYKWAQENYNKAISEGVSPVAAMMDSFTGVVGQAFAGRKNLGDVTTATLPFYYLAERLDNAVGQLGLGLSQKSRGSMQSILMNQFGRRIALPYMAYQQAVYFDGLTGDMFSDKAADTYVNMHQDVGFIKEFLGLNDIGRQWSRVFQGGDQITEMPFMRAFNFATFGVFGDNRSGEEIQEFYESGEVAVRKGRYWGIGSNTPYTGGKIDRYVPNWYRRAKSDYKFTDTLYGSESEYWANHWMPTVTNPLAPIRHFFLDPYHYEKKHEEDRPYPMTGGFSEIDQIPLIGPAVNNTVGRILKPRREHPNLEKAHREYIEELNANIVSQYEGASQGGVLQGMPAGGFNLAQGGGEGGYGLAVGGAGGGGGGLPSEEEYMMMIGAAGGATGDARGQLAAVNSYYMEMGGPSLGATGKNVRSLTALEDLRDPDVLADLSDIGTMHSFGGTLRDSVYSASEMAGIYGFLSKWGAGFEESGRGMTLEQSSRMSSYARAWWDQELGGLGGQLSEIGRRYVPRDPNKNYWNPIKNTMPDWLPGSEYFTDFKHGDPYVKIANGEMRLPGEAYEKLYALHPDALGEYGAFDRFRILADVAPYSENYKFYRRMVSKMNQSGMLTEDMKSEYAEIRDQVSQRKKKQRFYNKRFHNAEVEEETVTITRMLDATTFLTKEHPNNPIRMAGVEVRADDEESISWLQQYVYEGAKVRIAVDADPLYRVRDDTYNTMRAVVYANKAAEGETFLYSHKGQNVNFMLANRKTGGLLGLGVGGKNNTSVHDDGSATATQALFSKDMITVGKIWEDLTHDILPKMPIVGTIADKFLQIRTPLEMYKRQEIYGKAWRPWTAPIEGWIQPMLENMASQHPVIGAAQGAGIGWLFTRNSRAKFWGSRVGAVIGGGISTARVFLEQGRKLTSDADDATFIPGRRQDEREINEYFDKLRYVKYKGLYERTKREALRKEGVDLDEILNEHQERGAENKAKRNELEGMKKWLSMSKKLGYGDREAVKSQLDGVRADLKEIEGDRPSQPLGKYSMLALRYKAEYESTLYGADPNGDMTKIFRALPGKDREYFTEFMKAAPKEREEILRLVPKDQRRFYQAKWGLDIDEKESLRSYFSNHYLPDEDWEGWRPDTSLDNYKVKVVRNEGLEMTEFGYWADDVKRAEQSDAETLNINSISSSLDVGRLTKALRGAGLSDVSITMDVQPADGENKVQLAMDIMKDRSRDILHELNNNMGGIFG